MRALATEVEDTSGEFIESVSKAADIETACARLEEYLGNLDCTLLSVKFCDSKDKLPAIRCFGNYPCEIKVLSEKLRETGGCPMTKEAIRLLQPFDAMNIKSSRYPDFLSRRFMDELKKTGHRHVAVIPIVLNRGVAMYSIGLGNQSFNGEIQDFLVRTINQVTILLITRFHELTQLFVPKVLNSRQSRCLMLYSNGANIQEICKLLEFGEATVNCILQSCVNKLEAKNLTHAAAKAIRLGEFVNSV